MRLPASSKAYDAEQTLPSPPGGRNTDRISKAVSFVSGGAMINNISTSTAIQKHFVLHNCFRALYNR